MRTLHLDSGREMSGGQWQVIYLLHGLEGATLLARKDSPLYAEAKRRKIEVHTLTLSAISKLSARADLTHAHDARSHLLAAISAKSPLVVSRRVAFPGTGGLISRWKYSRAARYIAVSQYVAEMIPAPANRVSVVHDGVLIPEMAASADSSRVLALPAKGGELLKRAGFPVHFCHNLYQDLRDGGVFLYWSEMEGLGSAMLAAMAFGLPVIASRVGGVPEAVEHEVTGLLCDNHPQAFRAALERLQHDADLTRKLGRQGRERALERFSAETMRAATIAAYERTLAC